MPSARTITFFVALALFLPLLCGLAMVKWIESQMPGQQAPRVRGPHDLVGIQTQGSYAWVVPSQTGVVLIDAGVDPQAIALQREIGGRRVHAVLITHGHGDHISGLAALGKFPVYAARDDIALARGEREPRGFMARVFSSVFGADLPEIDWQETADGAELTIDGLRFRVVAVPGHTDGSLAYLWQDVLFVGDTVLGGDPLSFAPDSLADDPSKPKVSIRDLLPLDFDDIADGHVGLTTAARPALFRLAGEPLTAPTISLRSLEGPQGAHSRVQATGIWVSTPVPDVRGERPTYLVLPDGQRWRLLGEQAEGAQSARYDGRRVTVRGQRTEGAGGPGLPIAATEIELLSEGTHEVQTLEQRVGQWVTLTGTVVHFQALAEGALWGEGSFSLEGEPAITLSLSSPVALIAQHEASKPITLFGQIAKSTVAGTPGAPALTFIAAEPPEP